MSYPRLFVCEHCGNLVGVIHDAGVPMMCCGQKMTELIPGSTDAAQEKHVPVIRVEGDKVTVSVGCGIRILQPARPVEGSCINEKDSRTPAVFFMCGQNRILRK